jgi:membrane fusion protein, multidrug efflux system
MNGVTARWWHWALGTVFAVLVGYAIVAKVASRPAVAAGRNNPAGASTPVVAAHARIGDIGVYLTGLGTVTPLKTVTVRTQVDGQP